MVVSPDANPRLRWAAVAVFVAVPWMVTYALTALPNPHSELRRKVPLLAAMPHADTLIAGDSTVLRVSGEPFRARGWTPFNFGLSLANAEDIALEVRYALDHASIHRVVIGLTFSNMSDVVPFESSQFSHEEPFALLAARPAARGPNRERAFQVLQGVMLEAAMRVTARTAFAADGSARYEYVQQELSSGRMVRDPNPARYINRAGGEIAYRRRQQLSPHVKGVFEQLFGTLTGRGIPVVAFETGRGPDYNAAIAQDPLLARLLGEWRAFFRAQTTPCVRFLGGPELAGVYRAEDFFDAAHFIGPTEIAIGATLATALAEVEATCAGH